MGQHSLQPTTAPLLSRTWNLRSANNSVRHTMSGMQSTICICARTHGHGHGHHACTRGGGQGKGRGGDEWVTCARGAGRQARTHPHGICLEHLSHTLSSRLILPPYPSCTAPPPSGRHEPQRCMCTCLGRLRKHVGQAWVFATEGVTIHPCTALLSRHLECAIVLGAGNKCSHLCPHLLPYCPLLCIRQLSIVMLTTQPYTTAPPDPRHWRLRHISRCGMLCRRLHICCGRGQRGCGGGGLAWRWVCAERGVVPELVQCLRARVIGNDYIPTASASHKVDDPITTVVVPIIPVSPVHGEGWHWAFNGGLSLHAARALTPKRLGVEESHLLTIELRHIICATDIWGGGHTSAQQGGGRGSHARGGRPQSGCGCLRSTSESPPPPPPRLASCAPWVSAAFCHI